MTRTPDSNTEKLNALYTKRAFLKTKLELQKETYARTRLDKHLEAIHRTNEELEDNQTDIDALLDMDI